MVTLSDAMGVRWGSPENLTVCRNISLRTFFYNFVSLFKLDDGNVQMYYNA
jgi:hypothetical protein